MLRLGCSSEQLHLVCQHGKALHAVSFLAVLMQNECLSGDALTQNMRCLGSDMTLNSCRTLVELHG